MDFKWLTTVLVIFAVGFPKSVLSVFFSEHPFIVGGDYAKQGEFPYHVLMVKDKQPWCGAAIIDPLWVITAAHCFQSTTTLLEVVAGSTKLNDPKGVRRTVVGRFIDRDYKSVNTNDIAMFKLNESLPINNSTISVVKLADFETDPGTDAVVSGWGYNTTSGQPPMQNKLKKLYTTTISNEECLEKWIPDRKNGMIINCGNLCTYTKSGEGTCRGDSGGPLVDLDSYNDGDPVLIGIVSGGMPCAKGYPDVFTRVSSFLAYINYIVRTQ